MQTLDSLRSLCIALCDYAVLEPGAVQDAIDLYESIMQHHLGMDGSGSLLSVPPSALANLCVCHVISSRNDVAEDLLRRIEEEASASQVG